MRAFQSKNLTEVDALKNARLAKILTADDYDNGPILWTPTDAESRPDDGAGVQDEEDEGSPGQVSEGGTYSFIS